ncbi:MAG: hydrolase [Candidatus Binatia bacterium]|nr:MAG: hydrolase [Candidatus Binatia bacterium]
MREPGERFFLVDGGVRLRALEWGGGGPRLVLLLHGGSAHARWWDFFASRFDENVRVVALDLRGHGESHHTPGRYAIEDYAADVSEVLRSLAPQSAALVGHSLGGLVATRVAAEPPVPLAGLVLVDAGVRGWKKGERFLEKLAGLPHPVYSSPEEAIARFRFLPEAEHVRPEIRRHVVLHGIRAAGPGRYVPKFDREALAAVARADVTEDLPRIACPVLFVRGARSPVVSRRAVADLGRRIRRLAVVEIPDAGHHVLLENPAAFEQAVLAFLADRFACPSVSQEKEEGEKVHEKVREPRGEDTARTLSQRTRSEAEEESQ